MSKILHLGNPAPLEFYNAYTSASLLNIRTLRISYGASGHSRSPNDVSGLWFEYYDQDKPTIVGQWIEECGSLDLAQCETITQISFWISNTRNYQAWGKNNIGITSGIRIVTSKGQTKEVVSDAPGTIYLRSCSNRFEELVRLIAEDDPPHDF
jgi:hypothetical protein